MIEVRLLRPDEWEAFRDVRLRALADPAAGMAFLDRYVDAAARPEDYWHDRVLVGTGSPDQVIQVADGGDRLVGMAGVFTRAGVPVVWGVWVEPAHRGAGLADRLLAACEQWASGCGHPAVTLEVHEGNARARRFYERRGYAPTGRTQPFPRQPSAVELELAKDLRHPG